MGWDSSLEQFKRLVQLSTSRGVIPHPVLKDRSCLTMTMFLGEESWTLLQSATFVYGVIIGNNRLEATRLRPEHKGSECEVLICEDEDSDFRIYFQEMDAIRDLFRGYDNFQSQTLSSCYIAEHNWFSDEGERMPAGLEKAYKIISWIEVLKGLADYQSGSTCVYFTGKKLEMDVGSLGLLRDGAFGQISLDHAEELKEHLQKTDHQDVRVQLFKGTIVDILGREHPEHRLCVFFEHAKLIYETYRTSFDLYLENFSYEKLRTEAEKSVSEALKRLYDAVAMLRNQAVVIATSAIAMSQYSPGNSLRNSVILGAVLLATVIYTLLIRNQMDAVSQIEQEKKSLEAKTARIPNGPLAEEIKDLFEGLANHVKSQKRRLYCFMGILWTSFFLSLVLFVYV